MIIDSITSKFKNTQVFVISPEYAEYNCVIKSFDCENHFFSNLNDRHSNLPCLKLRNLSKGPV